MQIDLREVREEPLSIPSEGVLADIRGEASAFSSLTSVMDIVAGLAKLRKRGAGPVVVIDLRDGKKWRLPNLYLLARLLELEPSATQFVFTEGRGGRDGYLVGGCEPPDFYRRVEWAVPEYRAAAEEVGLTGAPDLGDPPDPDKVSKIFAALRDKLAPSGDQVHGFVSSDRVRSIASEILEEAAIEVPTGPIPEEDVRQILESGLQFVPTTSNGIVRSFVDRDAVALATARALVRRA